MRRLVCAIAATLIGWAPATALDLAPTGTLRATFISGNAVQAVSDPKTGETRGPAADIVRELARRAGVPFTMKGVPGVKAVIDSLKSGEADMGFLAYAADRAEVVDFASRISWPSRPISSSRAHRSRPVRRSTSPVSASP